MCKICIFFLFVLSINSYSQNCQYLYPATIDLDDFKFQIDSLQIVEFNQYLQSISKIDFYKIESYDFNKDGIAEYFAYYSDGGSFIPFYIFRRNDNKYVSIGEFEKYTSVMSTIKNGMPQIIRIDYEGEKTNPIYYPKVFSFTGLKYELLENPHLKIGDYRDLGLKYYKEKQYKDALICYLNILKPIWGMARITTVDYNNLALSYMKMNEFSNAKKILEINLSNGNRDAMTYYNLALIEESLDNKGKATEYYEKSKALKKQ